MSLSPSRIVCAAILLEDGQIVLGARHYDMRMHKTLENLKSNSRCFEQGFIDQHGTFFDRKDSLIIANRNNQILRASEYETDELYSENLY